MLNHYSAKLAYILANANRENEQAKANHSLAIDSLLASDSIIREHMAKSYSLRLLNECLGKTGAIEGRYQKIGFKSELPVSATVGELPVRYRTVTRKYLRTVKLAYGGEIQKIAYVQVPISDTEDAEPGDFSANLYPVFADEKSEQRNHVRATSKYARRELRKTTQETFQARQSEQVALWLAKLSDDKREEILTLLESPLNPVDPHYVSNVADPIWQKELDTIETQARAGDCPALRVSDWDKFRATVQYTLALSDNGHWTRIGNAKHGDASVVLKANRFAEYRRQYLLNHRWLTPMRAEAFETLTGIERDDTSYLLRTLGMGIHSDVTAVKRPGNKNPSDRVRAARERARAKRAARLASK